MIRSPFEDDSQSLYDEVMNAPDPNEGYSDYVFPHLPCEESKMHSYSSDRDIVATTLPSFNPKAFTVRDSGQRAEFNSGMVRDVNTGKMRPDLVRDGPMLMRWIILMTRGAVKYAARNWMKAEGQEEYDRFLESADRHYTIWYHWRKYGINIEDPENPTTEPLKEDHAAATFFNINGVEYTKERLSNGKSDPTSNS